MAPADPLTPEQQQVLELTRLAGLNIRDDIFVILLELMQSDATPMLVLQVLRSLAGVAPQSSPPATASARSSFSGRFT
ncbi:hypothetical protein Mp_1g15950 [Marchantia polymorpha subsp. ruderalis]|uniref:Mitotic-spindle organizing protein associated with a ring of gamma-tubulin 1 n=2 Tax=Marchantia polymorpha TaxID=3197 RepID=A0A176VZR6_MARPO|nr:hypothetical protein AXG93_4368s1550 [Marchantia polymorpha subsp. ruderalis]PTQ41655.1 hypothetical protein MARPO_0033s0065 [Marchantia polymorpha]BBM98750.1 hypothetical protein Mp_1g15950 [Marchantia polymorpha subsp. ruderalis]|eukprot:PTQ41655.1 hypothetical protein MARPO_0033s0065 [Marchantia polymorpha]